MSVFVPQTVMRGSWKNIVKGAAKNLVPHHFSS